MWNRKELKAKGKAAFKANYWKCVLVSLITTLVAGVFGGIAGGRAGSQAASPEGINLAVEGDITAYYGFIFAAIGGILVVSFLVNLLVMYPLTVGCDKFFIVNTNAPAEVGEIKAGFKKYGRNILSIFLANLLICLGTIVIIPGIILTYSYRLVPYILADNDEISATDAIKLSREMMKGYKWKSFVLELSFIGWILLTAFTGGLVGIFYFFPYCYATYAEMYKFIASQNGNAPASKYEFVNTINNAADKVGDAVENAVDATVDKVSDVADAAGDKLSDVVADVKDKIDGNG